MRTLDLLILDDHLATMRTALKRALCYYTNFDPDIEKGVEIGAIHKIAQSNASAQGSRKNETLKLNLTSNAGLKEVHTIVDKIKAGDWDERWDGIILDDNWETEENCKAGTEILLPLLRERPEIEGHSPRYIVFTQHIEDRERGKRWSDTIASNDHDADKFDAIGKEESMRLSQWLQRLTLGKRSRRRDGDTPGAGVSKVKVGSDYLVITLANGTELPIRSGRYFTWVLWIFRLRASGVSFLGYQEYFALREGLLGKTHQDKRGRDAVTDALAKLKRVPEERCRPPTDVNVDAQGLSKALCDFFNKTKARGVAWPLQPDPEAGKSNKSLKIFDVFLKDKVYFA